MLKNPRILIIGKNSYIGIKIDKYLKETVGIISDRISIRNIEPQSIDFSSYSVVVFAAGIAHVSTDPSLEDLYFSINRDLPYQIAIKAKDDGVSHFIYLSSMIVYGDDLPIRDIKLITEDTVPIPTNFYGKSKLEAESLLLSLDDNKFGVTLIRLPMVYGPGCKGNFPKLLFIAKYSIFFPSIKNYRSMIYIDNLCEFLSHVISGSLKGILFPQNTDYVCTKDIIYETALALNKKMVFVGFFNSLIIFLSNYIGILRKIFSTKVYDSSLSTYTFNYNIVSFRESIRRCVQYKD